MKKIFFLPIWIALQCLAIAAFAQSKWSLDSNHSQLAFSVALMNISDVEGSFKMKKLTLAAPKADFSDATLLMEADTKTINTGIEARDAHLRKADFFDADKYPVISFKSTAFKKTGTDKYLVTGELSMHGITKPVTLEVLAKSIQHPMTKKMITGFRVSGIVKRSDFGISPDTPPDMLSNDVMVRANVQLEQQ